MGGEAEEAEEELAGGGHDKWLSGTTSRTVNTLSDIRDARRTAAHSDDVALPTIEEEITYTESGREHTIKRSADIYVALFTSGIYSIENIIRAYGKQNIGRFAQTLAIAHFDGDLDANLVYDVDPGPSSFGITVIDFENIAINPELLPENISIMEEYNQHWRASPNPNTEDEVAANLDLHSDIEAVVTGLKTAREYNHDFATTLKDQYETHNRHATKENQKTFPSEYTQYLTETTGTEEEGKTPKEIINNIVESNRGFERNGVIRAVESSFNADAIADMFGITRQEAEELENYVENTE